MSQNGKGSKRRVGKGYEDNYSQINWTRKSEKVNSVTVYATQAGLDLLRPIVQQILKDQK